MELTKMMIAMKAAMRAQMTMVTVLKSLCGVKQLQALLKASVPHPNVQNAA